MGAGNHGDMVRVFTVRGRNLNDQLELQFLRAFWLHPETTNSTQFIEMKKVLSQVLGIGHNRFNLYFLNNDDSTFRYFYDQVLQSYEETFLR